MVTGIPRGRSDNAVRPEPAEFTALILRPRYVLRRNRGRFCDFVDAGISWMRCDIYQVTTSQLVSVRMRCPARSLLLPNVPGHAEHVKRQARNLPIYETFKQW